MGYRLNLPRAWELLECPLAYERSATNFVESVIRPNWLASLPGIPASRVIGLDEGEREDSRLAILAVYRLKKFAAIAKIAESKNGDFRISANGSSKSSSRIGRKI